MSKIFGPSGAELWRIFNEDRMEIVEVWREDKPEILKTFLLCFGVGALIFLVLVAF